MKVFPLDTLQNILAMILVLGVLIFFHELGHFVLARRAGILCREFALGMGPKLFAVKKGETVYSLRAFPIGGFVRMAGEDPEIVEVKTGQKVGLLFDAEQRVNKIVINYKKDYENPTIVTVREVDLEEKLTLTGEHEDGTRTDFRVHPQAMVVYNRKETQIAPKDRQFSGKTIGQRFATLIAGPGANFLLAAIFLMAMAISVGVPVIDSVVGKVVADSPAEEAGLQAGDKIMAVNGKPVDTFGEIRGIVSQQPGEPVSLDIRRDGERIQVEVVPEENELGYGVIGVAQAVDRLGLRATYEYTWLIVKALGMLFTGQVSFQDLSGPLGIYHMTGEVADRGIADLIMWSAILSINLGIINLLPIPALDGGRLLFLGVEALRGRPIDPQREGMVHFIGFAFLILLMLVITWNDIQRFFIQS